MSYHPSSAILFLAICSLNKAHGGEPAYNEQDSITVSLEPETSAKFLQCREQVRQLVKRAKELDWQGVPLFELEFNRDLTSGRDFGGHHTAQYYPALRRYEGSFFQTLGIEGKRKLYLSKHHTLFLSGLYGLVRPLEPIQLYSCPVKPQVADLWLENDLLTEVLCEYVQRNQVARIFDLTALVAYRNLIDWTKVSGLGVDVLHCFDTMSSGDPALIPFGLLLKNVLLEATEEALINIEPEAKMGSVVFRTVGVTQPGLPDEIGQIQSAEKELPLLQAQSVEYVNEVLHGGHPIIPAQTGDSSHHSNEWLFAISSQFRKDFRYDKALSHQVMKAILEICRDPMTPRGDTIKPLTQNTALRGKWRYRLGDHRLIYQPDKGSQTVYLLKIASRGDPGLYE